MEINKKMRRKITIVTILLSVEILFSLLSLSSDSLAPFVSILIAAVLIYLTHRKSKNSFNNARVLLLIVFLFSSMTINFSLNSQYQILTMVIYAFQIAVWATAFFLVNSIYKRLSSEKAAPEQYIPSPIPGVIQPIDLNKKISPKILILIFAAPIVVALIVALVSWLFNSN